MTDDNYQKFLLDNKLIDIHDFARKIYEYETGGVMRGHYWDSPFLPEQVKNVYLTKAVKLLEWLSANNEIGYKVPQPTSSGKCQCGCDCLNANCKCH